MHRFPLSRRKFLTLSGAGALGALAAPFARACPDILDVTDPMKPQKDAATAINAFGADLHARLAGTETGNLFFSPFSIETALAMTSAGARGKTLDEMVKVLHLPTNPHAGLGELAARLNETKKPVPREYELSVANAIWAQNGFPWEKTFLELTHDHYGAGLIEADFAADPEVVRTRINEWVEQETKQKIKDLIGRGALTPLTRMVLANAIYFKSNWLHQFDKKLTEDAPFTRADGTTIQVPLMSLQRTLNYAEIEVPLLREEHVQVLELPYAGKELSMLVFLPESPSGVHKLARWMNGPTLTNLKLRPTAVQVGLPRFKAESTLSLNSVLMDLGMPTAFGDEADFTGMSPMGKDLYIAHVLHKAFVDVNEEGTEAAAATAVVIALRGIGSRPQIKVFRADRPFVYAIRDNATGAALFLGRYMGV